MRDFGVHDEHAYVVEKRLEEIVDLLERILALMENNAAWERA
jgi:hypothetical protein